MRKHFIRSIAVIAVVALVALIAVYAITRTEWGHEQVRRRLQPALQNNTHGILRIGRISGNLLEGFTVHDLTITDSAGAPFIDVDSLTTNYGLNTLRRKHVEFDNLTLFHPVVVLDRQPGGKWNYDRIYPRDTMTRQGPRPTGWGTWVRFTELIIRDGDLTVKSPWEVDNTLKGAAAAAAFKKSLSEQGRLRIVKVPGGYQKISSFHRILAYMPLLRLEDPAYKTRFADVAVLSMMAEPFKPPTIEVKTLHGKFEFTSDSVWWANARAALPNSRIAGAGLYHIDPNNLHLRLRAAPVATADLRWVDPGIPEDGSGSLDFGLDWIGRESRYLARRADVRLERARLRGDLGLIMNDTFALHDTNLRVANLDTRLVQRIFPSFKPPRHGIVNGHAELAGGQHALDVNGDITFDERRSGRSRVVALGRVGFGPGTFNATNLRLTLRPLQVDLAKEFAPTLPMAGTLTGTATLNGSTTSRMVARGDITHLDRGALSRVTGTGAFRTGRGITFANTWMDVDARLHPLSLVTVGRFAPTIGLRGSATGPIRMTGMMRGLSVRTDLAFPDGGTAAITGRLDLASVQKGYDVSLRTDLFNANTIVAKAPRTSVTATATAVGRGFDPATMNARIVADIQASSYDTLAINSAKVRVSMANGLARIDTLALGVPEGFASATGTFGLKRGTSGELRYHIAIDSLQQIAGFLPAQQGEVPPRPGILRKRISRAQADSARLAEATEVERAVTGRAPAARAAVDTPGVVQRGKLSGSFRADGAATGNIHDFGATGTASGANIVALGNTVQAFRADYSWTNALTPQSRVIINANANELTTAGFNLDSVQVKVNYQKPLGTLALEVHQDTQNDYAANANFVLNKDRNELRLNDLRLRFDTTVWASTQPAGIHWGPRGIDVERLELRNTRNGRIFVNGLLPKEGAANFEIAVDNFAVEDLVSLAQSDIDARGLVSFDMRAAGTAANPTFNGAFGTQNFIYNGTAVPELHGTLQYANQNLSGRAEAMRPGQGTFLVASGTIPINLAFTGVTGSRFPTDRQMDLAIRADSLPLDMVPQLNTIVTNVRGHAVANVKVGGTLRRPEMTGQVVFDDAEARVVPAGVNLSRINGSIRMLRDTIVVDSLVAYSEGRIAITGGLGIGSFRNPSFDLKGHANRALVLDNDNGRLLASADLSILGPFNEAYVSGGLRILDGVLQIPESEGKKLIALNDPALFSVLDTAVSSNKEIFPTQSPLLANLRMDVNLRVDRDVFVRSRDANIEVYSDGDLAIHVNRARQSLIFDGVLLSERGEYRFLTKRFEIKRGSATFINIDELNPTLQVTGAYEVRLPSREAINIEILIGGTLLNPRISLESDAQPPIPQSDILSYLAFGRSSSSLLQLEASGVGSSNNLIGAGAALAAQQLASVALGVIADEAAGEAAQSLGADVFTITPADVQTDVGGFLRGTEVEFGKYIKSHTFVGVQIRPDPEALKRPGLYLQHRFGGLKGYRLETSFEPRFILREPSLAPQEPSTTSVLGLFLIREWRF
ncbi:MAG TPA: translocation/assembly module TamB domain-containing protein [Gemmatimonadaceae bacterium]|nr:translocation/assembly module TamB domain-containing protein [Gemmatimonadaceae bacterium]